MDRFWDELTIPGPRLPLTRDAALFRRGVELGRELLFLHTYGEKFTQQRSDGSGVPRGAARFVVGIPEAPEAYPENFSYDPTTRTLRVGVGTVRPVDPAVYSFAVSGHDVLKSWLAYRMKEGAGRRSSPLDDLRPERWTRPMSRELLELVWVLEATVGMLPTLEEFLDLVLGSDLFTADQLPSPSEGERQAPIVEGAGEAEQLQL